MPIPRYELDDRNFQDLVQEMIARIPAHTPEWTNPQEGDPGHTIIDLFAWLADTLLYRINLIPERQRLEFLRLLNIPMQPAIAATGLVVLEPVKGKYNHSVNVPLHTAIKGPVSFETSEEITVFPITGKVYIKRRPTEAEKKIFAEIQLHLEGIYDIDQSEPYVTTPMFQEAVNDPDGIDVSRETIDQSLWIAILAPDAASVETAKNSFHSNEYGEKIINIGFAPRLSVPNFDEDISEPVNNKEIWQWEMPSARTDKDEISFEIPYLNLKVVSDSTKCFTGQGIVKLALPSPDRIALPDNSVDINIFAGTGNLPPRIDNEEEAGRLVTWIRLSPKQLSETLPVRWLGVNAVSIDQRKTIQNVVVAAASGAADLQVQLPGSSVDPDSFELQVEEIGTGYQRWYNRQLLSADRNDRFYELDAEAGIIKFGDGVRGKIPEANSRIRIQTMRYGGGKSGNISQRNLSSISFPHLKLVQPLETSGGVEAETLSNAEKRIPRVLKHCHRAVTRDDYASIAMDTPGVELARVEVLPRFKPQQRMEDLPGIISVMVLPKKSDFMPPNPKPDRNILSRVYAYLEERRPIGVELYVIGTEYISLGLSVAVSIRDGFPRQQVMQDVQNSLREFLWSLTPGGHQQTGWQLGRSVIDHELEVVIARVKGILTVNDINMFKLNELKKWEMLQGNVRSLNLESWQLPELLTVVVTDGDNAQTVLYDEYGSGDETGDDSRKKIPIPVVPEICRC